MSTAMKILPLVIMIFVALAVPVSAGSIIINSDDPQFSDNIFQNKYMKLEFKEGSDYVYNVDTGEVVFETLGYNLRNSEGKIGYTLIDAFECLENDDCVIKEKEYYENSKLEINYKMIKDGTVKMVIEFEAGAENDYILEYIIKTSKEYQIFNESNYAIIGGVKYDWSDTFGTFNNTIIDNGDGFTHEIELGHLKIGEKLEIDPLIVPATTVDNEEETTLFKDNTTGYFYFLTRNTTDRLLYRSTDEGDSWSLFRTNNDDFYNNGRMSGVINREPLMIEDFDTTAGFTTFNGASISQNTTDKIEGIASLNFYDSSGTAQNPYIDKNIPSTNLTNRTGYLWFYVDNKSAYIDTITSPIRIRVSSDGFANNLAYYPIGYSELVDGWNLITIDFDNPNATQGAGANLSNITNIRYIIRKPLSTTLIPEGSINFDFFNYGNSTFIHFAEIGCRYGNYSIEIDKWNIDNSTSHCWNYRSNGLVDDTLLSMAIDEEDNLFVIGTYNYTLTRNFYIWWRNQTGWASEMIVSDTPVDDGGDISASKNYVVVNYQRINLWNYESKVFNKTSWSMIGTSEQQHNTGSTGIEGLFTRTTDYDNDVITTTAQNTQLPNSIIYIDSWNGTGYTSLYNVNLGGITPTANLLGFGITKENNNYYYGCSDPVSDNTLIIKFNATDFASGNIGLDVERWINLTATMTDPQRITSASEVQVADLFEEYFYYAYKSSTDGYWYFDKYQKGVFFEVYDEKTYDMLTNWTLDISNTTYSKSYNTTRDFLIIDEWQGNVNLKFSKDGYYDRFYSFYIDDTVKYFKAYLLDLTEGQVVNFIVTDDSSNALQDVFITVEKFIGTSWELIQSRNTDASGTASFFLNPETSYRITATKSPYTPFQNIITPTLTEYYITLGTGQQLNYTDPNINISKVSLLPIVTNYRINSTINNIFEVRATNNTLQYWGMTVTWYNGTVFYSVNNTTSSMGGIVNYTHYYDELGNFTVRGFYKPVDYSEQSISRIYYITNQTYSPYTLNQTLYDLSNQGTQPTFILSFLAIFIAMFLVGVVARYNTAGASVIAMVWLGVATYIGWFDPILYIITCIVGVLAIYITSNLSSVS